MTTTTNSSQFPAPLRLDAPWLPAAGAALTAGITTLFTYLALHNPPGVVPLGGNDFDTDFANDQWVTAGLMLLVPIFLISFRSVLFGLVAAVVAGVGQLWIANVVVDRYAASDWSDGLEGLAYVYALLVAVLFVGAALVGWGFGAHNRRRKVRHASGPGPVAR